MARDHDPSHHGGVVFSLKQNLIILSICRFFCQYTMSAKLLNINKILTFCSYNYSELVFLVPNQDHPGVYLILTVSQYALGYSKRYPQLAVVLLGSEEITLIGLE